jgi:hypothetical protein
MIKLRWGTFTKPTSLLNKEAAYCEAASLFIDLKAVSIQLARKVKWRSRLGKVFYRTSLDCRPIELKLSKIGTEEKHPSRRQSPQAVVDQRHMISLYIQKVFHTLTVTKRRGIHDD